MKDGRSALPAGELSTVKHFLVYVRPYHLVGCIYVPKRNHENPEASEVLGGSPQSTSEAL